MTKLVLKTIAITLVSVLVTCLIAFGALALFVPATVARFFDGMGSSSVAVFFYEKQYRKTDDIDDLTLLVIKANGDSVKMQSYLEELIERDDFENYCTSLNDNDQTGFDSREYYYGALVGSMTENGDFVKAISVGVDYVKDYGYTELNPLRVLLDKVSDDNGKERLTALKDGVQSVITSLDGEQLDMAQLDITAIDALIG